MKTAEYWDPQEGGSVRCGLCPHRCKLADGETGLCKVRVHRGGEMKALCYGMVSSAHEDPIEKKPLYHFYPGSTIFSIGGWGCNFACSFCQNWTISQQVMMESRSWSPADVVRQASGSTGVAYTYNEPIVGFEFVRDCALLVRERGLSNVLVTNGYVQPEPAAELLDLVDALNIDVKSMDESFYVENCGGRLAPVLQFAVQARDAGCHVEITNLLIPGLNDADAVLSELACWIRKNLGRETPLHLSAYRPQYKMAVNATSRSILEKAFAVCSTELDYVYLGNVISEIGQDTRCPGCSATLVARRGYTAELRESVGNSCGRCGRELDIVLKDDAGRD